MGLAITVSFVGVLAAILNVIGFALYFRALNGRCKSTPTGWFLSTVIALLSAVAQFSVSTVASSLSYLAGAVCCIWAFKLSYSKSIGLGAVDVLTVIAAVLSGGLSVFSAEWSVVCLCTYYLLSYSIFLRAVRRESVEPVLPWLVWSVGAVLQIMSIDWTLSAWRAYALPATNLLCWISVASLAVYCRKERFRW